MSLRLGLILCFATACTRPHASVEDPEAKAKRLVLRPLGAVTQAGYPGDTVTFRVVAFNAPKNGVEDEQDLTRAAGVAIAWSTPGASSAVLSSYATATDGEGMAEIAVTAGSSTGLVQVQAVASGSEPIIFSFNVKSDVKLIELLVPSAMTSVVSHTEVLRLRVVRPASGGSPGEPVAGATVTATLVGGARNGAGLDAPEGDSSEAELESDAQGLVTLRFDTGTVANSIYEIEICKSGDCPGIQTKEITVTVKARLTAGGDCVYFTDCADGYVCDGGECRPAAAYCDGPRDCPTGYTCSDVTRVCEIDEGADCDHDSDCEDGEVCGSADTCIPEEGCQGTADCPVGWSCDAGSGACTPPSGGSVLDVRGRWDTRYHFDLTDTLPGFLSQGLGPIVDFLNLVFASQLEIDVPILGDLVESLLDALIAEYVPPWVPRVTTVLGDFIHLFEQMEAMGEMLLVQTPASPLGPLVSGQESWQSAQLYVASLCPGGPAQFAVDRDCGRIDVVLEPTVYLSYSDDAPTVGVKVSPFNGEVLGDTLKLNGRNVDLELRQLVNVALDLTIAVASDGDYFDFELFLVDAVPCDDIQDAFDDMMCELTDGDVCSLDGIEEACVAASIMAVQALTDVLGEIPVSLELDFDQRALIHDLPQNGVADVLGSPQNPQLNVESSLTGVNEAFLIFGGELDDDSYWFGER